MKVTLDIPAYNSYEGFTFTWFDNFTIHIDLCHDGVMIKANKDGLLSLAAQLITLAQDDFREGEDIHLDKYAALEPGSIDLIIVKTESA